MSQYSDGNLQLQERNTSWAKVFEQVPDNTLVLDVGCSSGRLGKELIDQKNCEVYGIEIDPGDAKEAKKILKDVFTYNLEAEAPPAELQKLKFDVIILADVIEHFVKPAEALRRLEKLLGKNGRIVFSIPNMSHISVRMNLLMGKFGYAETGLLDKTHLHFYDYDEVKRVMSEAGLQIMHTDANSLPYTKPYLQGLLKKLKLEDKGFIETIMKDELARTFQFIGFSVPAQDEKNINHMPLHTTTPEHDFVTHIHQVNEEYASLKATNEQLRVFAEELKEQNRQLLEENHRLHSSAVLHPITTIKKASRRVAHKRTTS